MNNKRITSADIEASTTLDEAERAELKNPGYELFVAGLSLLSIVNLLLLVFIDDSALQYVLLVVNGVLSVILFLDFVFRFLSAPSRSTYFFRGFGWADLLASVPLAQFKILRVFRLARVYRLLREYGPKNVVRSLLVDRAGSALYTLLLVAIVVLEFGSLQMLRLEEYATGANITSASDALWYVIVTISTVGYGDQFPVTNAGRLLGSLIIVVGVAIFGTLTGFLANTFLGSGSADSTTPEELTPDLTAVDRQLERLTRLAAISSSGILSDSELAAAKQRILSDLPDEEDAAPARS
jgi:voltage-gated potassium channel